MNDATPSLTDQRLYALITPLQQRYRSPSVPQWQFPAGTPQPRCRPPSLGDGRAVAVQPNPTDRHSAVVKYDVDGRVAKITLNRPERLNAWTPELGDLCIAYMLTAAHDPEVRAIVLTGAGRGFCAGADIDALKSVPERSDGPLRGERHLADALAIPKPIIAAINGAAIGIGLLMAALCDIRFAASGAKLGTGYAPMGLPAEDGMSWVLQRIMGLPAALEYLLSGRIMEAEEAAESGLVHRVFPQNELLPRSIDYALGLARNCSPWAMAAIKHQIYQDADNTFHEALLLAKEQTRQAVHGSDFREGLASYKEKRAPNFPGISTESAPDCS
jgi:enoyl-CoA hydratase/carnithine racemase